MSPARRAALLFVVLAVVASGLSIVVGRGNLSDAALRDTFVSLRLSRLLACAVMGASLGVSGALVQGLFRNPLADTGVIGTTAGAVLGGKVTLVLVDTLLGASALAGLAPDLAVPVGSIAGAALALVALRVATHARPTILVVLLVGFSLSSLFGSLGGLVTSLAQDTWELGRALVAFALGSVSGTSIRQVAFATPLVVIGTIAALRHGAALDVLLTGDAEATTLGLDVAAVRNVLFVWVAVLTGAAVSLGGFVGFVGLVVPHALRPIVGAEHRTLLPLAGAYGALFVALADIAARAVPTTTELPLGVVSGLVGAPFFLALLLRSEREGRLDG